MNSIVLNSKTPQGDTLQAIFLPEQGMNLISYKKNALEIIDQSTRTLFEERFAGLGALIGPHFHHRNPAVLPKIADETLFPHIASVKAKGIQEPFSHGIARYAPWKATATANNVKATLSGKDTWNGVALAALEGQNFSMNFSATLTDRALELSLDVVSDTDSVVGIHYYYHLPQGKGQVISGVQPQYLDKGLLTSIPKSWMDNHQQMTFDLEHEADYTFYPFPEPRMGNILLDAGVYKLVTTYESPSQENCWQLYHPKGASFVCIEPLSAKDPRHPNLSVSSLKIALEIRN